MQGMAGKKHKQDCWVQVEILNEGGVEIRLFSTVEKLFGKQIRQSIQGVASEMGVDHARIEMIDDGCYDFAIRARVKSAINRARRDVS